jgi:hypothetical protein
MSHHRLFKLRQLPHVAVAIAAATVGGTVFAQNVANGKVLYETTRVAIPGFSPSSCGDCHGTSSAAVRNGLVRGRDEATMRGAISGAIGQNRGGMGAYTAAWGGNLTANVADVAAYLLSVMPDAPPPPFGGGGTAVATPTATPNPATFANTAVGGRSSAVTIMVTNAATTSVTFAAQPVAVLDGGNTGDFWVNPTPAGMAQCTGTLAPGMSCALSVDFRPSGAGTRSASWALVFTNANPRTLTFSGTAGTAGTGGSPAPAPAPAPTPAPTPSPTPAPTPTPAPAPAPTPTPAATPSPATTAAGSSSSGGGGALPLLGVPALLLAAALRRRRRD